MNRSSMPKQVMTFSNGGLASFIPRQTSIMGQPHMLAYINPREEQILQDYRGNAPVLSGPAGVPSYGFWDSVKEFFGGGGNDNSSAAASDGDSSSSAKTNQDRINEIYASSDDPWAEHGAELNKLVADRSGTYSGGDNGDSGGTQTDDDSPAKDVGLLNSLLMGTGLKDKTPEYYSATADTLARQYGPERAQTYINEMRDKGNITTDLANALMESTTITGEDYIRRGLITDDSFITNPTYVQMLEQAGGVSSSDDNGSGSDQTGGDDQTDGEEGDGEDEDTGPPSSMNFRFYGGYQPRTRADVLVASPGANQPFVMPDDPRITPIFNPDDNIDEILKPTAIGPTEGYGGQLAADILATDYGPTPFGPIPEATTDVPVFGEEGTIAIPGSDAVVPDFNPRVAQGGISAVEQRMIDQFGYTANPDGTISRGDTIYDSEQGGFLQGGTAAMTPAEILAQQQRIAGQASDLLAQQGGVQKTPEEMLQQIQATQARYRTGAPGAPAEAFDFGAPANVGDTYFDPMTNTTYEYTEKPMGNTGQTYQGWDIKSGTGGVFYKQPVTMDPGIREIPKNLLDGAGNYDGYMGFYDRQLAGEGIDSAMYYGGGALAQAPAEDMVARPELLNDPNYRGDGTNFGMVMPESFAAGVTPGPQMPGQGQFATMQELMEFQQQNPGMNLMGEYQRLKALEGGAAQPAVLPQRGVASLMGADPATEAMYQGIMS